MDEEQFSSRTTSSTSTASDCDRCDSRLISADLEAALTACVTQDVFNNKSSLVYVFKTFNYSSRPM